MLALFVNGAILVLADFFTTGLVDGIGHALALWVSIIAGVLLFLGLGNIARVHLQRLKKGEGGAVYSFALLASAVIVVVAGVLRVADGRYLGGGDVGAMLRDAIVELGPRE